MTSCPFKARIWNRLGTVEQYRLNKDGTASIEFRLKRRAGPRFIEEVQSYRLKPEEVQELSRKVASRGSKATDDGLPVGLGQSGPGRVGNKGTGGNSGVMKNPLQCGGISRTEQEMSKENVNE